MKKIIKKLGILFATVCFFSFSSCGVGSNNAVFVEYVEPNENDLSNEELVLDFMNKNGRDPQDFYGKAVSESFESTKKSREELEIWFDFDNMIYKSINSYDGEALTKYYFYNGDYLFYYESAYKEKPEYLYRTRGNILSLIEGNDIVELKDKFISPNYYLKDNIVTMTDDESKLQITCKDNLILEYASIVYRNPTERYPLTKQIIMAKTEYKNVDLSVPKSILKKFAEKYNIIM